MCGMFGSDLIVRPILRMSSEYSQYTWHNCLICYANTDKDPSVATSNTETITASTHALHFRHQAPTHTSSKKCAPTPIFDIAAAATTTCCGTASNSATVGSFQDTRPMAGRMTCARRKTSPSMGLAVVGNAKTAARTTRWSSSWMNELGMTGGGVGSTAELTEVDCGCLNKNWSWWIFMVWFGSL